MLKKVMSIIGISVITFGSMNEAKAAYDYTHDFPIITGQEDVYEALDKGSFNDNKGNIFNISFNKQDITSTLEKLGKRTEYGVTLDPKHTDQEGNLAHYKLRFSYPGKFWGTKTISIPVTVTKEGATHARNLDINKIKEAALPFIKETILPLLEKLFKEKVVPEIEKQGPILIDKIIVLIKSKFTGSSTVEAIPDPVAVIPVGGEPNPAQNA